MNPELAQIDAVVLGTEMTASTTRPFALSKPGPVPWEYRLWVSEALLQKLPP